MPTPTVFDKNGRLIKQLIIVLVIIVCISIGIKIYKGAKAAGEAAGDIAGAVIIQAETGITPPRQSVCARVAQDAHMAIHGDGGIFKIPDFSDRLDEDEDAVITALNFLKTDAEAAYTSRLYRTFWGARNLKADVNKYLSNSEKNQINSTILQALS